MFPVTNAPHEGEPEGKDCREMGEARDVDVRELTDAAEIDQFCAELLAALTEMGRRRVRENVRVPARLN
ncbi:MAG: hypothetical protein ABIV06_11015 [Thermoanaerobaculia bacterium]